MSLSRILKSGHFDGTVLAEFSFDKVGQQNGGSSATGFVPMEIFDSSEIDTVNKAALSDGVPEAAEPAGIVMTEEELDQQLREAFSSGLQEGKNLAERGLVNVFRSLRGAAEEIRDLREKALRESEDELLDLVMMISRKVILGEVRTDRTILENMIRSAVAGLSERDMITVRLNPDDHVLITSGHGDYFRQELMSDQICFKADSAVLPGNCQIDTELGTLDASIDAQLEEIYRHLLEERSQAQSPDA